MWLHNAIKKYFKKSHKNNNKLTKKCMQTGFGATWGWVINEICFGDPSL